ncbi:hypothetical protein B5F76_09125 [Desulfovibrio sp. An276]|nr:hypothetical protein B5F76_09125 [Desulfovibrio sp. An276]
MFAPEEERCITQALIAMAMNFNAKMPDPLMQMWLEMLSEYPAKEVLQAIKRMIRKYQFKTLPPFAVLQEEIDGDKSKQDMLKTMAEAEWGNLLEAIRSNGVRNEPLLSETTEYVLRTMGGWRTACGWTEQDLTWRHKDFLDLWTSSHGKTEVMRRGAKAVAQYKIDAALPPGERPHALPKSGHRPQASAHAEATRARRGPARTVYQPDHIDHDPDSLDDVFAGTCPECGGSGYIDAWRPGDGHKFAIPCVCNRSDFCKNMQHHTRDSLTQLGLLLYDPNRPTMDVNPAMQERLRSFLADLAQTRQEQGAAQA